MDIMNPERRVGVRESARFDPVQCLRPADVMEVHEYFLEGAAWDPEPLAYPPEHEPLELDFD